MRATQFRFLLAVLLCGAVIAALGLAFPTTTNAAQGHDGASPLVNAQAGFCSVTVRRGEALYMIAARYGTTTAYLAALNNLYNANYIYAGMVLKVPCAQPYPYPQPQPQPQPHPYPQPQPGYQICSYYRVERGDWLKTIAWRYGISWQLLAQANGLYNANYIYAGMILKIPCAQPYPPPPPPICPGCPPCQGCPPVYPTPIPICPGCPPCQGCPPVYPTPIQPTPVPVYNNVEIRDDYFAPPVLTIHRYQFVQWVNKGNKPHTVTQGLCPNGQCTPTPGGFDSGVLNPGGTYVFAFTQLGTFAYFDAASGVGATIAVVP